MTYSARSVAAQVRVRLPSVPVKKLHKILYYAQGYHLATFAEPLFSETVSAWDMGPVVGSLWRAEKFEPAPETPPAGDDRMDEAALNTVGLVVSRYGHLTGLDLEHMTHAEAPWMDANKGRRPGTSVRIPVESIKAYFVAATTDEEDAEPLDAEAISMWLASAGPTEMEGRTDSVEALRARLVGSR